MPARGVTYKIFVGNLNDITTAEDLKLLFEPYGTVIETAVVKNFGFVHMETEEARKEAIAALNNRTLHGQAIVVQSSTGGKRGAKQFGKVFVGNIAPDTKISDIRSLFETYGRVTEADLLTNYAFVHMDSEEGSREAIRNLDGYELNGSRLRVQESTSRVRQQPGMGSRDLCYRCGYPGHWSKECPSDRPYMPIDPYAPAYASRMERGPSAYGRRYNPYLPPPPPSFGRERMRSYRDVYDPVDRYERYPYYADRSAYERAYERLPPPPAPYPYEPYERHLPPRGDYVAYGRRSPPRYPPPPPAVSMYPPPSSRSIAHRYKSSSVRSVV